MRSLVVALTGVVLSGSVCAESRTSEAYIDVGWRFARFWNEGRPKDDALREPPGGCADPTYDVGSWRTVRLPHDWGVELPFTMEVQGALGHMAYYGVGWYKTDFDLSPDEMALLTRGGRLYLDFDGAMSLSTVYLNGTNLGTRPFGFISFRIDATEALVPGSRQHLAVRLENRTGSSRWYHGGGLYRRVRRVVVPKVHVDQGGVFVRSVVEGKDAKVSVDVSVKGGEGAVFGAIYDGDRVVARLADGRATIPNVHLWDTEDPHRYVLEVRVEANGDVDVCRQTFGVRTVEFRPGEGLFLNGRHIKFRGVCLHSDCGALGTAAYARVFERQVQLLKEMGCNAIRTAHNPASPDMLEACDRYGLMVMDEIFDMWVMPKGGGEAYAKYFKKWWNRDLTDFIRRDRNRPSVVLWSVGNEVEEQRKPELGLPIATALVAACHAEDPTRPVTMGNDWKPTWTNGYAQVVDIYGANYQADFYGDFYRLHPDKGLVGTETESLLSSRGAYYFPEDDDWSALERSNYRGFYDWQASSYEKYTIRRSNTAPEVEFKAQRKYPQCYGSFAWTGFDYLGEPSPYEGKFESWHRASSPAKAAEMRLFREQYGTNATPSRSSYYGIFDLCGFPKDRYWCYKAEWRPDEPVAHILPHWTWPNRVGKITPVYVYSNGDYAELFVNGRSYGRRWKDESLRLMWLNVPYCPGTVKVVVWKDGRVWATDERRTAGVVKNLQVGSDLTELTSLQDIAYVKVALEDENGVLVPESDIDLAFSAEGAVEVAGLCNGDPADLTGFRAGHQRTFHGLCQAIVRAREGTSGQGALVVKGGGLSARIEFTVAEH